MNQPLVGVLGLGRMGSPIARVLHAAGHSVVAFDRAADRMDDLAPTGIVLARSANELATRADVLITVLPGPLELDEAMDGPTGLLAFLRSGSLWIDVTSNSPDAARRLAATASENGIGAVFAPMGGGPSSAASGAVRFSVGGATPDVARAAGILKILGGADAIDHVGEDPGAGCSAKLIANLLWFGQVVAVTEALLLGLSLGIAPRRLRQSLLASAGSSAFIENHLDNLLAGDYLETFGIDRCVEELETLVRLADNAEVPFELSRSVAAIHNAALERFGAIDGELLAAKLLELRAGQRLSDSPG